MTQQNLDLRIHMAIVWDLEIPLLEFSFHEEQIWVYLCCRRRTTVPSNISVQYLGLIRTWHVSSRVSDFDRPSSIPCVSPLNSPATWLSSKATYGGMPSRMHIHSNTCTFIILKTDPYNSIEMALDRFKAWTYLRVAFDIWRATAATEVQEETVSFIRSLNREPRDRAWRKGSDVWMGQERDHFLAEDVETIPTISSTKSSIPTKLSYTALRYAEKSDPNLDRFKNNGEELLLDLCQWKPRWKRVSNSSYQIAGRRLVRSTSACYCRAERDSATANASWSRNMERGKPG